jgi:pantoate--beta-alanine ligase
MFIAKTIAEMRNWRQSSKGTVGFIPTMGYLHVGHISLVTLSQKENDFTVVSIFINPKQFGVTEDFSSYPRDTNRDLELLKKAGVAAVFLPDVSEMYPDGFETNVTVTKLSKKLEGEKRPGHFDGVATVVAKLFNIVQPDRAYFGQKDAQQVVVMKKMVDDLQFPVKIVVGDTIREDNGLALSSRNVYLTKKEHDESQVISQSLKLAQELFDKGELDVKKIKKAMEELINTTSGEIDYISIADPKTLDELAKVTDGSLISLAVYYGKTRLIDNCTLTL